MALVYTPPGEIDSLCPSFQLKGTDDKIHTLDSIRNAKAILIMFICNHCPYVKAVENRILMLTHEVLALGARVIAISSNDPIDYPEDSFENMKITAKNKNYPFPYLFDANQSVAKMFGAVCTPDFFLYDQNLLLKYRGRLDDSWKDAKLVSRHELRHAILQLLQNKEVPLTQYPSMGCSIKWSDSK